MGSLITRKKMVMMMQGGVLPSGYQKVSYIQSDGTSYIQTDVIPSNDLGFDCVFYTESDISSSGNYGCIFGARKGSGDNDYQLTTYANANQGSFRYGGSATANVKMTRYQICSAQKRYLEFTNCEGNKITLSSYNWNTTIPIALFILRNNTTFVQGGSGCRIYEMRFYDGDTIMREYIPCIRKSDNTPGMYERFTKQFLTNTVGTLTYGTN